MMIWTPSAEMLASEPETATDVLYPISGHLPPDETGAQTLSIVSASAVIAPEPPSGTLEASLTVSGPEDATGAVSALVLSGAFPPRGIMYRDNSYVLTEVMNWAALPGPEQAPDIISFHANELLLIDYVITGTVILSNGTAHSKSWVFRVNADWSAGRDILRDSVNARRSA